MSSEQGDVVDSVIKRVSAAHFQDWRDERRLSENIREGQVWLNKPPTEKPPEQHSPSQLRQCHRKIAYRQLNAPEESEDPKGIFWTGSKFEEEVALPYLEAVVGDLAYVRNSMWVDYTIDGEHGGIRIRGETDPVIVNAESEPLLLTEIKTKQSISGLSEPNDHHLAQLFAYMEGLSQKWETEVRDGLVIYGDRTTLAIKAFHIQFDADWWHSAVVKWAKTHTEYRLNRRLPPPNPEFSWECNFCSYKHRCGQASDTSFADVDALGFLPLFDQYPESKVKEYLEAHDGSKLIPTLAQRFPDLATHFDVHPWRCQRCSETHAFESIDWDGNTEDPPVCPICIKDGIPVSMVEPDPENQHVVVEDQ